jgi:hypothetical protein
MVERIGPIPGSSACGPGQVHPMEPRSGCEDESNHAQNTLSAETQDVRIFYPFHPLCGLRLQVIRKPKRGDGAVSIRDPSGKRLKVPVWMLTPHASHVRIVEQPLLSKEALLSLTSLIAPVLDITNHNLPQTVVDGCKGGQRGPTATSGSDDIEGTRERAGRSTSRTDRSDGARPGRGFPRRRRKNR